MENRFRIIDNKVAADLEKYNKEIEDIKNSDNPDPKKLQELYLRQLYRGMHLNTGYIKDYSLN